MRKNTFFTVLYILAVLLDGIMSFGSGQNLYSSFFEILGGLSLIFFFYTLSKEKKTGYLGLIITSFLLTIFYGYNFSQSHDFHFGIMALFSVFFIGFYLFEIFRIYININK